MGDAVETGITDGFPFDPETPFKEDEEEEDEDPDDPPGCDDTVSSVKQKKGENVREERGEDVREEK